jgi:uncharacterized protein (TIGR03067 family)
MRPYTLVLLALGLATAVGNSPARTAGQERKQLTGAWKLVSVTRNGRQVLKKDLKKHRAVAVFRGKRMIGWMDNRVYNDAAFAIDPSKTPKTIDITDMRGKYRGKKQLGIYEIDGSTLRICHARPGKKRPTNLSADEGSGQTLEVYKRMRSRTRR